MKRTVDIYKPNAKKPKQTNSSKSQTSYGAYLNSDVKSIAKLKENLTQITNNYFIKNLRIEQTQKSSSKQLKTNFSQLRQPRSATIDTKNSQKKISRPYESLQPKRQTVVESTQNLIKQYANQKQKSNVEKRNLWHNFLNNSIIEQQVRRAQSSSTHNMRSEPKSDLKYRSAQSLHYNPDFLQFKLSFSARTRQGQLASNPNKTNQDTYICETNIVADMHLFSVCDGHGQNGHFVSQYVRDQFTKILKRDHQLKQHPRQAIVKSISVLANLINQQSFDTQFSGTTMNSILIQDGGHLICSNVGDSRAIIGKLGNNQKFKPFPLSIDHKPCLEKEMNRIHMHGGRVDTYYDDQGNSIGPARVWVRDGNYPGLAMSRSLGDQIAQSVGVSSIPEIFEYQLTPQDKFIILGSDGVWEFIDNQSVVDIVGKYYIKGDLDGACDELLQISYKMWTLEDDSVVDDITFIVIFIS
ncbi:unnamed protein product [Paramecium sonneborni]|uniref:PPM-type phosphatase domain-containing protein n=1 Tax=Paramecium sonneborni TaxID=65129 RepID=A0A8S1RGE2_9CILI|nr:unnamed protein product [Paramecium sonneborni]